jgi:hypothetical protein
MHKIVAQRSKTLQRPAADVRLYYQARSRTGTSVVDRDRSRRRSGSRWKVQVLPLIHGHGRSSTASGRRSRAMPERSEAPPRSRRRGERFTGRRGGGEARDPDLLSPPRLPVNLSGFPGKSGSSLERSLLSWLWLRAPRAPRNPYKTSQFRFSGRELAIGILFSTAGPMSRRASTQVGTLIRAT